MMKRISGYAMLTAFILGIAASGIAADLRNEDPRRYEVKVHEGSTTRNTWIEGNSTTLSICSNCEIEVVGIGKIKVGGSEKLTIKGGKLIKQ